MILELAKHLGQGHYNEMTNKTIWSLEVIDMSICHMSYVGMRTM